MKKILSLVFTCFLSTLILLCSFNTACSALDSNVLFDKGANNFIFRSNSDWTSSDLFDNFKNMMPGDEVSEEIEIRNDNPRYDYIKLYMRAIPHDDVNGLSDTIARGETVVSMRDFLRKLTMKIYNADELIYSGSADSSDMETAMFLEYGVNLGKYYNGESAKLRVVISAPHSLKNKYSHRAGEIDWLFTAEAFVDGRPVDIPSNPSLPGSAASDLNTGLPFTFDAILRYVALFLATLAIMIAVGIKIYRLKKKSSESSEK